MNYNILAVDDIVTNLEVLEMLLDDAGYDVRTATSGEMALKSIVAQKPDLILLDIMMPGIDGYETCRLIKQDESLVDIPIIFLSAKSESEDKTKALELGAVDYLSKPFDSAEVLARINTHVSMYNLKRELMSSLAIMDDYIISSSTDENGVITRVSNALCKISGYSKDELIGKKHDILRSPDMSDEFFEDLWATIKSGKTWSGEIKNIKKNGEVYWLDTIITPSKDLNEKVVGYSSVKHDITSQKLIEIISITDELTGLYNRRHFNEMFSLELKNAIRQGSKFSFLMLDVDYFKQYNDTYGHQLGDTVLSSISKAFQRVLNRSNDLIFRLGGEEFGVIYSTDTCENATKIAEIIRSSISDLEIEHTTSKASGFVTISIGIVCIDFSVKGNYSYTTDAIYKLADDELYKAKENGRNRISMKSM